MIAYLISDEAFARSLLEGDGTKQRVASEPILTNHTHRHNYSLAAEQPQKTEVNEVVLFRGFVGFKQKAISFGLVKI